jgi:hypothetical protein
MLAICFLIGLLLGGASFAFYWAADQRSFGTPWASEICATSSTFCHSPEYLAYAGGVILVIAIGVKIGSLVN